MAEPECKVKGCSRPCEPGLEVCLRHGGGWPQARRKSELVRLERDLDAFITPIPDTDPRARPDVALHMEFKKTQAKIDWLERRIAETLDADSLEWGLTKEEQVNATEFTGTNRTYEARVPVLVQMLEKERAHLLKVTDLMARNHFAAAELAIKQQADQRATAFAQAKVLDIVRAMGRDPESPKVKARLARVFGGTP